jgi:hypothetical protein
MSKNNTTYIYALCDPDTNQVRYIGKADNLQKRLKRHMGGYEPRPTYKSNWVKSLKKLNKRPIIMILEEVQRDSWQEAEKRWIDYYRKQGANLTNMVDGGIGGNTTPVFSKEERQRRSKQSSKRMTVMWDEVRKEREKEKEIIKGLRNEYI